MEITGPWQDNLGHAYIGVSVRDINWDQVNNNCAPPLNCTLSINVPKDTCSNNKSEYTEHLNYAFPLGIEGGCCNCCGADTPSWQDVFPAGITDNLGLFYSIADKRWDVMSIGANKISDGGVLEVPPPVGGVTAGKYGEQIISQAGEIKALHLNASESKPWVWHSKQFSMGADTQHKLFKGIKVKGNHKFNATDGTEATSEGDNTSNLPGVEVYVDGILVDIKRKDDPNDMDATLENAEESQFHEYEYLIDKKNQKGSTVSVRLQQQSNNSIVESVGVIFRAKPVK